MNSRKKVLWKIFISTLYLSAFTFGGGYVIVSLMKKKFVDELHWVEEKEMLDLVAIAQSSPGAIAINGAIVVGYKLAGLAGLITYEMGTGVVKEKDGISLLIMAGAFVASCVFEVNVVYIVIICGLLGVLRTCMSRKGAGK